jgi:polyhydroxyalkanoate synthesis regulator phasin
MSKAREVAQNNKREVREVVRDVKPSDEGFSVNHSILVTIITTAAFLGGFYYTTQHRLDALEAQVDTLSKQVKKIGKKNNRLPKNNRK